MTRLSYTPRSSGGRSIVFVRLKGGLGNQLFQYAAALGLARELDAQLYFLGSDADRDQLALLLGSSVPAPPTDVQRWLGLEAAPQLASRALYALGRRTQRQVGQIITLHQGSDAHTVRPDVGELHHARAVGLNGYFQHPSWFEQTAGEVASGLWNTVTRAADPPSGPTLVLSFRRADYVTAGWALPLSYYERALAAIGPWSGEVRLVGDDPVFLTMATAWARDRGLPVIDHTESTPSIVADLACLARSECVVMSNSTFCWWGVAAGAAGRGAGAQTVIAPARWIPKNDNSDALLQASWRVIDV